VRRRHLEELGLSGGLADTAVALATPAPRVPPPDLSGLQLTLWSHLTAQPQHVDALVRRPTAARRMCWGR